QVAASQCIAGKVKFNSPPNRLAGSTSRLERIPLTSFVRVIPDGDILPSRSKFSLQMNDWQVAVNHIYSNDPNNDLWFSLSDIVVSKLLTGCMPKIVDAFRIQPHGTILGLEPTKLRGVIDVGRPCDKQTTGLLQRR